MHFKLWLETNSLSPEVQKLVEKFKSWDSSKPYPGHGNPQIYDFIAVLAGSKPAALASIDQLKNDVYYNELNNILQLINSKEGYSVKNFNSFIGSKRVNRIAAGLTSNVDSIIASYQDKSQSDIDHKTIGLALGYSPTQVDQFVQKQSNFKEYVLPSNKLKQNIQTVKNLLLKVLQIPNFIEQKAHDETESFWVDPKSPIYPWLEKHEILTAVGVVPPFAQGGVGRAYFLKKYVVKFSGNQVEANIAKMVAGRNDLPTTIIDVLPMAGGFYAILQHFIDMTNVSKEIKLGADYLTLIIDNDPNISSSGFPTNLTDQYKIAEKAVKEFGKGRMEIVPYMVAFMQILNKLFHSTGFLHSDAVPKNIGTHQGKIKIPDLGPNEDGNFNARKEMDRIHTNRKFLGLSPHEEI